MNINWKIMTLVSIGLIFTSAVMALVAVLQVKQTGGLSLSYIEELSRENIEKIESDGRRQTEAFRDELLLRKKEYLKSQVQTVMGVLHKAYSDAHDPEKLKAVYEEPLQNAVNTAYGILESVEKEDGLTLFQKKQKASRLIKELRYGPKNKDYFWINDMHPRMIMHPYKPQLNGQDLSEAEDPNGKKLQAVQLDSFFEL